MKTFRFITDPGHGWLRVPVSLLKELGIEKDISSFSMVSPGGMFAYLEEDCDYQTFVEAYRRRFPVDLGEMNFKLEFVDFDDLWHGRNFQRYSPFRFTAPPENREVLKSNWTAAGYTTPF